MTIDSELKRVEPPTETQPEKIERKQNSKGRNAPRLREKMQEKAITALLTNRSSASAAKELGINRKTLYEWRKNPDFARAYGEALAECSQEGRDKLRKAFPKAVDWLEDAARSKGKPFLSPKVHACASLVRFALEVESIEAIRRIERMMNGYESPLDGEFDGEI